MAQTEAFNELLNSPKGKINLPGDMHAIRQGKHLFLTGNKKHPPEPTRVSGTETVFGSFDKRSRKMDWNKTKKDFRNRGAPALFQKS